MHMFFVLLFENKTSKSDYFPDQDGDLQPVSDLIEMYSKYAAKFCTVLFNGYFTAIR